MAKPEGSSNLAFGASYVVSIVDRDGAEGALAGSLDVSAMSAPL